MPVVDLPAIPLGEYDEALRSLASITVLLLVLAVLLQLPVIHNMVAQLIRQSLASNSARGFFSHYKAFLPSTFLPCSTINAILNHQQHLPSRMHNHFTTSTSTMADSKPFFAAIEARRTYYQLSNESTISDARIKEIVAFALKHTPSSFNSQTSRLVVVLNKEHQKLWDTIMDVYKTMLGEKFEQSRGRFEAFKAAYGTVSRRRRQDFTMTPS